MIRLRTINRVLAWVRLALVVAVDDLDPRGSTTFCLERRTKAWSAKWYPAEPKRFADA